jgi:hypothetical protein
VVRTLPGSQRLKGLLVFDEVHGSSRPTQANPPTKRPLVALMKQARAFGVGVLVDTPADSSSDGVAAFSVSNASGKSSPGAT